MSHFRKLLPALLLFATPASAQNIESLPGVTATSPPSGFQAQNLRADCTNATPTSGICWPVVEIYNQSGILSTTNGLFITPTTGASFGVTGTFWQANQPVAASVTNAGPTAPTSTLTLTSTTTAFTTGQLIANNGTAGSITVPSFAIANSAGAATIRAMVLTSNDSISTGWGGQTVQIDLWSAAPTFTNGDHAAYVVATGSAGYLGSFTCFFQPVAGDGAYANCAPLVQPEVGPIKLASGTSIFWTAESLSGTSGVVTASKAFTIQPKVYN